MTAAQRRQVRDAKTFAVWDAKRIEAHRAKECTPEYIAARTEEGTRDARLDWEAGRPSGRVDNVWERVDPYAVAWRKETRRLAWLAVPEAERPEWVEV